MTTMTTLSLFNIAWITALAITYRIVKRKAEVITEH